MSDSKELQNIVDLSFIGEYYVGMKSYNGTRNCISGKISEQCEKIIYVIPEAMLIDPNEININNYFNKVFFLNFL